MDDQGSLGGAAPPLRHSIFRALWIASVAANVGTWMQTVGASWLMTSLAISPLLVALVQTATTLPVFLLSVPAGAMADLVDRRRLLIFTQSWMLAAAAALGVLTMLGRIGPWGLLALTFALGLGATMNGPAWAAAIPELVPRTELAAAVALNSVGFNIARAIGPAFGGIVMAASNAGVVFLLNAISFLAVILVLWKWRHDPRAQTDRDEQLGHAMRAGFRYVRDASSYHSVLIRAGLFSLGGSALWAMLPVVARTGLASTETGYGILLGCLGAGSVIGAAILAPLRSRYSPDHLVAAGVILFAGATAALALRRTFSLVAVAMPSLNVWAQMQPPPWVRARALSFYLLVFQGALAVGSSAWGTLADRSSVKTALLCAAAALAAGLLPATRLRLANQVPEESTEMADV